MRKIPWMECFEVPYNCSVFFLSSVLILYAGSARRPL